VLLVETPYLTQLPQLVVVVVGQSLILLATVAQAVVQPGLHHILPLELAHKGTLAVGLVMAITAVKVLTMVVTTHQAVVVEQVQSVKQAICLEVETVV
jgi:hypothetical protein